MVKIKIKTEGSMKLIIPVPYFALHFAVSIIFSKFVWKQLMTRRDNDKTSSRIPSTLNNQFIKPLIKTTIKEFQNYRGITLIDIKESDGTEITIKL
ncbi:hypothetical protein [Ornithinibacillus bavariensis]|nr:hypothetical protein [Ornithinibacillus bavariensis]